MRRLFGSVSTIEPDESMTIAILRPPVEVMAPEQPVEASAWMRDERERRRVVRSGRVYILDCVVTRFCVVLDPNTSE